jgi:3-oxoacyl-[acyl-carrier protein] reductase
LKKKEEDDDNDDISSLFRLSDKVAVVTGGSRGIGAAITYRLAQAGADVAIVHSGRKTPRDLTRSIGKLGRTVATLSDSDVSEDSVARRVVREVIERFGHVDILVNCAGIYPHSLPERTTEAEWDRVLDTNLKGAFLCSREVAKEMTKARRGGRMVNIASIDAFVPERDFAHYDASKAGLVGLTRSLALSWGRHRINVNAVAPGLVDTGDLREVAGKRAEAFERFAPLGGVLKPEDVANLVLFLCSEAASKITGQTIVIDSGVTLSGYTTLLDRES